MSDTLATKSMQAVLSIKKFGEKVKDTATTNQIHASKGVSKQAGYYLKRKFNKKFSSELNRVSVAAREYHNRITWIWGDKGERILPASKFMEYSKEMRDYHQQFDQLVTEFMNMLPTIKQDAQTSNDVIFDPDDWPSDAEIKAQFIFDTQILPTPVADDFRVELAEGEVELIREKLNQETLVKQEIAYKDLWSRLYEPIEHMIKMLETGDARLHKSLTQNIVKIAELLPDLNIMSDPDMDAMCKEAISQLCGHPASELKSDPVLKKETVDAGKDILSQISNLAGKGNDT